MIIFLHYRLFYYNHFRSLNVNPNAGTMMPSSQPRSSATTPEPAFVHPNNLQPPLSVTEDGYLGDCSSDGGNEKNFPMVIK